MKSWNKRLVIVSIILFILSMLPIFYKLRYCSYYGLIYYGNILNLCNKNLSFLKYIPIIVFSISLIVNLLLKQDKKFRKILYWFIGTFIWYLLIVSYFISVNIIS